MRMFRITVITVGFGISFLVSSVLAKPLVSEAPLRTDSIDFECVSISTSTWTQVPSSNTSGRVGFELNNPASNSSSVHGFRTSSSDVPSDSTSTTKVVEFSPSSAPSYLPYSDETYLWLVSQNSSAEDVCVQEYKQ